jgi:hypothetical protein
MEKTIYSVEEKELCSKKEVKKVLLYLFKQEIPVECNKELSKEIFFGGVKPWKVSGKTFFFYPCEECKGSKVVYEDGREEEYEKNGCPFFEKYGKKEGMNISYGFQDFEIIRACIKRCKLFGYERKIDIAH